MLNTSEDYLRYLPFLSNGGELLRIANITIEKIEDTKTFDTILGEIYDEISTLITNRITYFSVDHSVYEVSKFYMTILLLKGIDNIAITRIWVKHFMEKIQHNMKSLLMKYKTDESRRELFLDIFRLLEKENHFILSRVTLGKEGEKQIAFGLPMLKFLDVFDTLLHKDIVLHKGHVIFNPKDTDFLISFIQKFAEKKIYRLYEQSIIDVSITRKIKLVVEKIRSEVIKGTQVSINIKKHFIRKELLEEQERIKDVEQASQIIKEIDDPREKENINVSTFPPCINVILNKIFIQKIRLSHNENILLCTYLGKKHFDIEQVKKIFSKSINYDKKTTDYQVSFLYNKHMMPMNCDNLDIEHICMKQLDKTNQCSHIKNPLSFR